MVARERDRVTLLAFPVATRADSIQPTRRRWECRCSGCWSERSRVGVGNACSFGVRMGRDCSSGFEHRREATSSRLEEPDGSPTTSGRDQAC